MATLSFGPDAVLTISDKVLHAAGWAHATEVEALRWHVRRLTWQRDQLASLARRWVPSNDDGMGGTDGPSKAPTHPVDAILAGPEMLPDS